MVSPSLSISVLSHTHLLSFLHRHPESLRPVSSAPTIFLIRIHTEDANPHLGRIRAARDSQGGRRTRTYSDRTRRTTNYQLIRTKLRRVGSENKPAELRCVLGPHLAQPLSQIQAFTHHSLSQYIASTSKTATGWLQWRHAALASRLRRSWRPTTPSAAMRVSRCSLTAKHGTPAPSRSSRRSRRSTLSDMMTAMQNGDHSLPHADHEEHF